MWNEVVAVLTDPEYLNRLAATYLTEVDDDTIDSDGKRRIDGKLGDLRRQKVDLARKMAENANLDFLEDAISGIDDEMEVLRQ